MAEFGYHRFVAQGGDIGAGVSVWLARLFPDIIRGIHLNSIPGSYRPPQVSTPRRSQARNRLFSIMLRNGLRRREPMLPSKPRNHRPYRPPDGVPIGLTAGMMEKFRSWTDCNGDLESVIPLDDLLTDISLYWFGDPLTGALRLYKENWLRPLAFEQGERVEPPLGVSVFPREIAMPRRSWVERVLDVQRWTEMPVGGHFVAMEKPDLLAAEMRAFFRPFR